MTPKTFITKTKNGFDVYVDTGTSHAATHLKNHPELFDLMKEVLASYEIKDDTIRFETDLGRIIGEMDLVETSETDDIFYAKRPNRDKYTRFVKNKSSSKTSFVTIELHKVNEKEYDVFTVYIGKITPSLPYGKDDPDTKAREFWKTHALVAGNQEFSENTVTTECPW